MKRLLLVKTHEGNYERYVLPGWAAFKHLVPFQCYFAGYDFSDDKNTWLGFRWLKENLEEYIKERENGCH